MRWYAKRNGLQLSDKRLRICRLNPSIGNFSLLKVGDNVICASEEDIFEALDLKYSPPSMRSTFTFPAYSKHDSSSTS